MSEEQGIVALNGDFCQRLLDKYAQNLTRISRNDLKILIQDSHEEMSMNAHMTMLFDFCIIASEADTHVARNVKQHLCQELHIRGCIVEDVAGTGKDTFNLYENMMERSTKILFLITNNFTSDGFCMRIQNGAVFRSVVEKAATSREKCVPLILESGKNIQLPLALTGITGIKYNDTVEEMSPLLLNTFVRAARNREIMQRRYHQQYFKALLDSNIKKFIAEQNNDLKALEFTPKLQIEGTPVNEANATSAVQALEVLQKQLQCKSVQDLVSQLQNLTAGVKSDSKCNLPASSGAPSSQQCQVSHSENVQFGDRTIINLYVGAHKAQEDSSPSNSNSDESDDNEN